MKARTVLSGLIESDDIKTEWDYEEPQVPAPQPSPTNVTATPPNEPSKPSTYVVKSLRGMRLDDLYDDKMTMVILKARVEDRYGQLRPAAIGIVGHGKPGDYGNPGDRVAVKLDMGGRRGGYRFVGGVPGPIWTIAAYAPATDLEARRRGLSAKYHFD